MTVRRMKPTIALVLTLVLAACATPPTTQPPRASPTGPPAPSAGVFSSADPGSVNTYWISAPAGVVLVDALRTLSDARTALSRVQATGRPVTAILITHPHPDHVGGLEVFHQAYPDAPIYANVATTDTIATDALGYYALTHQQLGDDAPAHPVVPDRVVTPNATLEVAGLQLETAEFGANEDLTAVAYYLPDTGALFAGDMVGNQVTPALTEGHTCGWLTTLDQLATRFPNARTVYPGHGNPGPPAELIDVQRDYLRTYRALIRPNVSAASPGGSQITTEEQRVILTDLERRYPNYPRVASLPNLQELNVQAVATELRSENPTTEPAPCRP